ncbi:unnamed protein product [Acanthosepion pharaonis]|uniref:Uncharacterized protein n=1 Tax=Acanthosepion pharaonis TaxID=158019 RepID=A0A812EUR1_ACAPH|nr:unnamed protein product [Sepia pharaonis]
MYISSFSLSLSIFLLTLTLLCYHLKPFLLFLSLLYFSDSFSLHSLFLSIFLYYTISVLSLSLSIFLLTLLYHLSPFSFPLYISVEVIILHSFPLTVEILPSHLSLSLSIFLLNYYTISTLSLSLSIFLLTVLYHLTPFSFPLYISVDVIIPSQSFLTPFSLPFSIFLYYTIHLPSQYFCPLFSLSLSIFLLTFIIPSQSFLFSLYISIDVIFTISPFSFPFYISIFLYFVDVIIPSHPPFFSFRSYYTIYISSLLTVIIPSHVIPFLFPLYISIDGIIPSHPFLFPPFSVDGYHLTLLCPFLLTKIITPSLSLSMRSKYFKLSQSFLFPWDISGTLFKVLFSFYISVDVIIPSHLFLFSPLRNIYTISTFRLYPQSIFPCNYTICPFLSLSIFLLTLWKNDALCFPCYDLLYHTPSLSLSIFLLTLNYISVDVINHLMISCYYYTISTLSLFYFLLNVIIPSPLSLSFSIFLLTLLTISAVEVIPSPTFSFPVSIRRYYTIGYIFIYIPYYSLPSIFQFSTPFPLYISVENQSSSPFSFPLYISVDSFLSLSIFLMKLLYHLKPNFHLYIFWKYYILIPFSFSLSIFSVDVIIPSSFLFPSLYFFLSISPLYFVKLLFHLSHSFFIFLLKIFESFLLYISVLLYISTLSLSFLYLVGIMYFLSIFLLTPFSFPLYISLTVIYHLSPFFLSLFLLKLLYHLSPFLYISVEVIYHLFLFSLYISVEVIIPSQPFLFPSLYFY